MSEGPYSDPSGQNPPTSDGTWQPPPPYTPPYQAPAPSYLPPAQPGPAYDPAQPYQQPYQQPAQPGQAYDPTQPYQQPAPAYDPAQAYQTGQGYQQNPYGVAPTYPGYPQATGWQQPPPPKRRTGLIIGIVVAVVLVLCIGGIVAVSLAGNDDKTGANSGTNASTSKAPVVAAIALGDGTALKAHLAKPPSGAKASAIDNSTGGIQTLDQFVANSFPDSPDEKGILQTRGFEVVAENNWRGTDGVSVDTQLIQFSDADGAVSHVVGQHGAYGDDKTITSTYALAGLSNGYGYERSALDKYGNRQAILTCNVGNIVIVMFIFTPGQLDRAGELADMQRQVAALAP